MAVLGGHLVRDEGVAGSNPATPTNKIKDLRRRNFEAQACRDRNGDRNALVVRVEYVALPRRNDTPGARLMRAFGVRVFELFELGARLGCPKWTALAQ